MDARLGDASRYDILFDQATGDYLAPQVGGIRTKIIRAGDTLELECYPLTRIGVAAKPEYQKRRQRPGQAALNRRNAQKRVRRLLEANFTRDDFAVHPTWDYNTFDRNTMSYDEAWRLWEKLGLPIDEDDARRALTNYLLRIKRRMRRAGTEKELKYLYVMEVTCEPRPADPNPMPAHYHFHLAIHAPGLSREELEDLWGHGYANSDRLDFHDNGLAALANYITKQNGIERLDGSGRKLRRWGHSRNLKEPDVRVSDRKVSRRRAAMIAQDVQLRGAEIFERLYPGYRCMETPTVRYSDFVAGAYIFARLRRVDTRQPWERTKRRRD